MGLAADWEPIIGRIQHARNSHVIALVHAHQMPREYPWEWYWREFIGPRRSIDLTDVPTESVFIGDESSVGLACALHTIRSAVSYIFEAVDPGALSTTLEQLALPTDSWTVVPKTADRVALLDQAVTTPTTGDYDLTGLETLISQASGS